MSFRYKYKQQNGISELTEKKLKEPFIDFDMINEDIRFDAAQ